MIPQSRFLPDVVEPPARRAPLWTDATSALAECLRGHLAFLGPVSGADLGRRLDLPADEIDAALIALENTGAVMRGTFTSTEGTQWCDRRLLARINRMTVDGLRRAIEPVSAASLLRFFFAWQHVSPSARLPGRDGLLEVVGQLQGFEAAAGAWERALLPARVAGYEPAWLDELCLAGELAWGRITPRPEGNGNPSRAAPIALLRRRDLSWLLETRDGVSDDGLSSRARVVLDLLRKVGASFIDDLAAAARTLRGEVEEALWELVAAGRVTGDGFAGLRSLLPRETRGGGGTRARWYSRWSKRQEGRLGAGRWSLLSPLPHDGDRMERLAEQYIRRYGVVFREVLARESHAPPWREIVRVYRRLEMRGELRGGRLVAGFVGEQFAAPEALESLRAIHRRPHNGEIVQLSGCDPLNLVGVLTPGARVPATLNQKVAFKDGVPLTEEASAALAQD